MALHNFKVEPTGDCSMFAKTYIDGKPIRCRGYTVSHYIDEVPTVELEISIIPSYEHEVAINVKKGNKMAKFLTIEQMAKEVADEAMKSITLNGMTLEDFVDRMNSVSERKECHVASCRYNSNGICQNEDKRKECVDVSMSVLCLEDFDENNNEV